MEVNHLDEMQIDDESQNVELFTVGLFFKSKSGMLTSNRIYLFDTKIKQSSQMKMQLVLPKLRQPYVSKKLHYKQLG